MKETLRHRIIEMLHGWDHLQLSQFTIDWIQEFEENFTPDCPDNAIAYNLDIIREVLCFGADKDFFEMLHTFARLYVGSNAEAHGRRSRTVQPLVGSLDSEGGSR